MVRVLLREAGRSLYPTEKISHTAVPMREHHTTDLNIQHQRRGWRSRAEDAFVNLNLLLQGQLGDLPTLASFRVILNHHILPFTSAGADAAAAPSGYKRVSVPYLA